MTPVSFAAASAYLADLETIDFYFAQLLIEHHPVEQSSQELWFHVLLALSYAQRQGHTCLDLAAIAETTWFAQHHSDKPGYTFPALTQLVQLVQSGVNGEEDDGLVFWQQRLYSQRYWQFESDVADAIVARLTFEGLDENQYQRLQVLWPEMFAVDLTQQQDWQQIATANCLCQRFAIINGGPGTGKTYTVTRLLLALQAAYGGSLNIQLAAPTGKAAQRLAESVNATLQNLSGTQSTGLKRVIPVEAITLHRLLGLQRLGIRSRKNAVSPLSCDVLIVDEASMVDLALMARVCRALPAHARLILVGDAEQLPAVESGNVLEALLGSATSVAVTPPVAAHLMRLCAHLPSLPVESNANNYVQTLQVSRRFAGPIAAVAGAIKNSDAESAWQAMTHGDTLQGLNISKNNAVVQVNMQQVHNQMAQLARTCFSCILQSQNLKEAMTAVNRCRWLTPVRKGPVGVEQLNYTIERGLGVGGANTSAHYRGRPIMVLENQYSQGLFNGDVGLIWPDAEGRLKAWFEQPEGGYRSLSIARLPRVETVFAMTVHKSQGSEFGQVVLFVPEASSGQADQLCTRELLYTGLTRAKQGAILVTSKTRFADVIALHQQRFSGLAPLIAHRKQGPKLKQKQVQSE